MSGSKPPSSRSTPAAQQNAGSNTERRPDDRRARRRKAKERREGEAGPSGLNTPAEPSEQKPTGKKSHDTFEEADFIKFTFSDEEEKAEEEQPPVREWDKGKGKASERDHAGRKRKSDEFDLDDGYANKKERIAAAARQAPWATDVDWESCANVAEMLHRDVEAFVHYISPTPEEDEVRSLVVAQIARAVHERFPDAQVHPFGSYETKLYLPTGDIDLVIHSQSMARSDKESVLHSLANTVKRAGITDRVRIIAKAKVPIVKFVTTHGRFSVDISVNQINGVAAGKMIRHFLQELPALRSLVLVIKSFLAQRSMNEVYTGGLGSYSIVCLAISFLQMHPKVRRGEIDPSKNLGVLVMEFFELYGCYFNYSEVGISIRDGGTYFNKRRRGWLDYGQSKLLSIEDPGDPSNDISRGSYNIAKVRATLAGAHGLMTSAAYMQAGWISANRDRRRVRLGDGLNRPHLSILARVMGVTQETINHRRLVQEVFELRVLHRMLGIAPRVDIVSDVPQAASNGKSNVGHKESVETACKEAEVASASNKSAAEDEEEDEEEESRYKIDDRREPPRKRRRLGRESDMHTVFTTDEEDPEDVQDYNLHVVDDEDSVSVAKGAKRRVPRRDASSKRDYWLSKGLGFSGDAIAGRQRSPSCSLVYDRCSNHAGSSHADLKQSAGAPNAARAPGSLRDKIASFEKQGAVPVPRGSFGLGAPPVDDGSSRRRGELMGNRVPGLSRPVAPAPTHPTRATSPSFADRSRAASATLLSGPSSRSVSPTMSADGEADSYGSLEAALEETTSPRHSGAWQARRRSVSDIVAKFSLPAIAVESLPEGQEEAESSTPAIVLPEELRDSSSEPHPPSSITQATSITAENAPDHSADADGQSSPAVTPPAAADEPSSSAMAVVDTQAASGPAVVAEQSGLPVISDVSAATETFPSPGVQDQVATAALPVAASDEPSGVSADTSTRDDVEEAGNKEEVTTDEVISSAVPSSASLSKHQTPQDSFAFPSVETVPSVTVSPVQPKVVDMEELGNQSLALDTQDAVIITEPPRVVTPVVTRGVLVPVSPISPRTDNSPSEPIPSYVEPSLTPKTATGSFRAVVHHKVTEGANRSTSSQAQRVSDLRAVDSPKSPGFTDLADLLADAALLEKQLSGLGSPRKLPVTNATPSTPPPASALRSMSGPRVEVTIPDQPPANDDVSTSGDGHGSSEYNSPQEFPPIPAPRTPSPPQTPGPIIPTKDRPRSRLLSDTPPPVPPKSPRPRYFSTLLSRRPSAKDGLMPMPGAYPRDSVCSEMSEDDSVLATPPSPRFDAVGSDTSSVMSSSRSWKMPSKGLARATSFADRLWHKRNNRNTVLIASPGKQHLHVRKSQDSGHYVLNAGYPDDDSHLSINTAARPRKSEPTPSLPQLNLSSDARLERQPNPNGNERPMSWVSVSSSIGSGGLDSALFDSFPSVPDTVPNRVLPIPAFSENHASSSGLPRDSLSGRIDTFPTRSSSLHPKQRSALL
ncbi:uncharacterized protein B0H18DRAFT_938513 [Fomitopsis serialis]|uniref:uncharacterized protein n=1 Tax=Fomitopsis serialis TaxID=139415 RepID=UPI0020078D5E|nr:uncharacterized protein B0H18DRAFT_938513 [Neoantrodia serialis]KAH9917444.1 hypothetical protein B0H18DRAFT_938513 [Neoantrodia serialis]